MTKVISSFRKLSSIRTEQMRDQLVKAQVHFGKPSCATHRPITTILRYALQINEISHFGTYQFTEYDIPWKGSHLSANDI
jgi:hypothetical protein